MPRKTGLTDRERQVLALFALGQSISVAARTLGLSQGRVRELADQIRGKLSLPSYVNIEMIVKAGRDAGYIVD